MTILDRKFNFTNVFNYIKHFKNHISVHLWNLKGFDLNFMGKKMINYKSRIGVFHFANSRLDFYHDKKRINSCDDISKSNISTIMSFFQLRLANITSSTKKSFRFFVFRNVEYKRSICPLVFNNSNISRFVLIDLVDTFYKRSVLSFTNDIYNRI